jgi:hypothetical protein
VRHQAHGAKNSVSFQGCYYPSLLYAFQRRASAPTEEIEVLLTLADESIILITPCFGFGDNNLIGRRFALQIQSPLMVFF